GGGNPGTGHYGSSGGNPGGGSGNGSNQSSGNGNGQGDNDSDKSTEDDTDDDSDKSTGNDDTGNSTGDQSGGGGGSGGGGSGSGGSGGGGGSGSGSGSGTGVGYDTDTDSDSDTDTDSDTDKSNTGDSHTPAKTSYGEEVLDSDGNPVVDPETGEHLYVDDDGSGEPVYRWGPSPDELEAGELHQRELAPVHFTDETGNPVVNPETGEHRWQVYHRSRDGEGEPLLDANGDPSIDPETGNKFYPNYVWGPPPGSETPDGEPVASHVKPDPVTAAD